MIKKLIQLVNAVKKNAIKRLSVDGKDFIAVSASTLPDDVIMNGVLYPASVIKEAFPTLEGTQAPLGHPLDGKGELWIPSSHPDALANYSVGATNVDVHQDGGRVHMTKLIDIEEAGKTDRGKRLLEVIASIESGERTDPIHSSVTVWANIESHPEKTTSAGKKYSATIANMVLDHDAFLLDEEGAATPEQGVGVAVNAEGEQVEAEIIKVVKKPSMRTLEEQLEASISESISASFVSIIDIVENQVIFETETGFFQVPFAIGNDEVARITGMPLRVDRVVTFTLRTNEDEGNMDRLKVIEALVNAGVSVPDGASDETVMALLANMGSAQVEALETKIDALANAVNAKAIADKASKIDVIVNSGKYPGVDKETLAIIPNEKINEMASYCGNAGQGIDSPGGVPLGNGGESSVPTAMPGGE